MCFFFLSLQIVEFKEKESSPCEIDCSFYLAVVKHSSIEDDPHDDSIETEIPKMYLKVLTLIEFDTFVITHGPFTSVDGMLSVLYLHIANLIWMVYIINQLSAFTHVHKCISLVSVPFVNL